MGSQVVTGATLQCSMGTFPSTFAATGIVVSATTPAGVITDTSPENVPSFGLCMSPANPQVATATTAAQGVLTPQPCLPVLTPWAPGAIQVSIGGVPALDDASQCSCAWAGVITVTDPGQISTTVQ
jgi:Domain of unknown function (DUF4280)